MTLTKLIENLKAKEWVVLHTGVKAKTKVSDELIAVIYREGWPYRITLKIVKTGDHRYQDLERYSAICREGEVTKAQKAQLKDLFEHAVTNGYDESLADLVKLTD